MDKNVEIDKLDRLDESNNFSYLNSKRSIYEEYNLEPENSQSKTEFYTSDDHFKKAENSSKSGKI